MNKICTLLTRLAFISCVLLVSPQLFGQLTGIKNIPGDYPNVTAAVADVNFLGVGTGGVTFNIAAGFTENTSAQITLTATGTATNPIIFQKSGAGANPVISRSDAGLLGTSILGGQGDAVFLLSGSDFVTINGIDIQATSSAIEYGIMTDKPNASDGCKNITIQNCVITLTKGTSGFVIGLYISNGPSATSVATGQVLTSSAGANENITIIGNTIQNVHSPIYVRGGVGAYDQNIIIGQVGAGNTLQNYGGGSATATYGIYFIYANNTNVEYNTINNAAAGGSPHASSYYGVFFSTITGNVNCNNNAFTTSLSGTSITYAIQQGNLAASENYNNNTFASGTITSTGTHYMISASNGTPVKNVTGNSISGTFTRTGAGSIYVYYNLGFPASGYEVVSNNNFSNIQNTGTGGIYGIYTNTSLNYNRTCTNNICSNLSSGTGIVYAIYTLSCLNNDVNNNVVHSITTGGSVYAYYASGTNLNHINNRVYNVTTGGTFYGVYGYGTNTVITNDTIYGITQSATGTVYGIFASTTAVNASVNTCEVRNIVSSGTTTVGIYVGQQAGNVSRNKVYNLTSTNTLSPIVSGIAVYSNGCDIINNIIGDLKAPAANSTSTVLPSIRGVNITSVTALKNINLYHNTIFLNANSTGGNFSTAGVFATMNATATTAKLKMVGNIIVNSSVPNGTGVSAVLIRSAVGLANFDPTSNNNCYYAGAPSASNLILNDGTNIVQTLSAYQALTVAEASTLSFMPNFINTTPSSPAFVHIDGSIPTQLESGSINLNITNDYDNEIRALAGGYTGTGSAPDIGADEFIGITPAPSIVLASAIPATTNQCTTVARVITATITTVTGTITGATLNYSFNGVAQTPIVMVNSAGNSWTGTIPASTPANATVTWSITATNSVPLSSTLTGTPYADEPLLGVSAFAYNTASPICAGTPSNLAATLFSGNVPINYTIPTVSSPTFDEDLGTVQISQGATMIINNVSLINNLTGTMGTATGTAGGYSNFTAFGPDTLTAGQTYNFSLSSLTTGTSYNNHMRIYLDLNRNGLFTDVGECMHFPAANTSGPHTETGSFTVPLTAFNGLTRMRVFAYEGTPSATYINAISWGEFEDYLIFLSSPIQGGGAVPAITSVVWNGPVNGAMGTGNPLAISPTLTDAYTATITAAGCVLSSNSTTVTVNPLPSAPSATNSTQCGLGIPTASVASTAGVSGNGQYYWFNAAANGSMVQTPPTGGYTTFYSESFTGPNVAVGGTISGSGNLLSFPGEMELFANAANQIGGITVAAGVNASAYMIDFDLATSTGADGVSYSFGDDVSATATNPTQEKGSGSKLKISFDSYGVMPNGQGVYLLYNNTAATFNATTPGVLAYSPSTAWINDTNHVSIMIDNAGKLTLAIGANVIFNGVQLPPAYLAADKSTWQHVISGRTGAITMMARIDNLLIQYANNLPGNTTYQTAINATTTYYVTEQGTNGCYSPLTPITVTVVNPDPITVLPGATASLCFGQNIVLDATSVASPAYTYSWDANNYNGSGFNSPLTGPLQTITPTVAGSYVYTVTGTNGVCTATATVTTAANALPILTTVTGTPNAVCNNGTINLAASSFVTGPQTLPAGYCSVTNMGGTGSLINNFVFNTINNNTSASNPVAMPYFTTYNQSTTVNIGQTYPLTVTINPVGTYPGAIVSVWIDYNRNGVYDAIEWQQVGVNISGGTTATINVTIPMTALPGLTGLRLRSRGSNNVNGAANACTTMGSGETEDYQVNIQAGPSVPYTYTWNTIPPAIGATATTPAINNTAANMVVSYIVTALDSATGCSYQDTTNNITIYPPILAPTVLNSAHCGIQIPTASANDVNGFVGPNYNWYASPVNSNSLQTSAANTFNTLVGTTSTLYVSVTDTLSGCETNSTPVTITVTAGPTLTLANTQQTICVGNSTAAIGLSAGAANYNSYTWSPATGVSGNEVTGWTFNPAVSTTYTLVANQTSAPNCSNQDTISISVDQIIPPAPVVAQNSFNVCSGTNSVLLNASAPVVNNTFTYTLNFFDSFGDGWNGNTINVSLNGTPVLSGVTLATGSTGSLTFTVTGGNALTTQFNAIGSWINECTYNIVDNNGNVIFSGTPASGVGPPSLTIPYMVPGGPQPTYTVNWYNASVNGTNVGTGSPLQAVGTTVMPTTTNGTYTFYAGLSLGACNSATTVPVTVNVADVAGTLTTINTCINTSNGTFTATNFTCGTAPFDYSVNNGVYGPIPTNLAAGTYTVVIRDANLLMSPTYTITIGVDNIIPPAPTVTQATYSVCTGTNSVLLTANAPVLQGSQTYTLNFFDSFGDGWNNNTINVYVNGIAVLNNVTLPSGSIGSATFTVNNGDILTTQFNAIGSWINECTYSITAPGGGIVFSGTPASAVGPPSLTNGITITTPAANPQPNYILNWYNASSNGAYVGTGSPLQAVGTIVMPTTANGSYTFYVGTTLGACNSATTVPVTVIVSDVAATITPINATCNGVANGSFTATNFICGTGPFDYSVNNGPFGAIPANLPAGTHTVVIRDANNMLSTVYTINITQPAWFINAPVSAANGTACVGDLSEIISASSTINGQMATVTQSFTLASNVFFGGGGTQTFTSNITLPAGATVTGTQLSFNNVSTANFGWPADYLVALSGASTLNTTTLANVFFEVSNAGPYFQNPSLLNNNGGNVTVSINNTYAPGTGFFGSVTLNVTYTMPAPASATTWWNASTGGVQVGTGNSLESVGTSVLVNTLTPGVYNFYAQGEDGGCTSATRTLVTVTVNALPNVNAGTNSALCIGQSVTLTATGATNYTWNNGISNGVAFNPNTTNTYIVNGVDGNGCANQDTVTVVVNPLPVVYAGLNQSVCLNSSVVLSGSGAASYTWTNGINNGVSFTPTTTNNYVVTGTDINGCVNTDTVTVTVLPLPTVNAGQDMAICLGSGTSLVGTGAQSYQWTNGVINAATFFPITTLTYVVTGTASNGCIDQDSVVITVNTIPTVTLTNGGSVCANGSVVLNATTTNAFGGFWSTTNGSGVISPNVSNNNASYSPNLNDPALVNFNYVAFNQCGPSTATTTIGVLPLPSISAGLDLSACTGDSVSLSASSNGAVVWDNGVLDGVPFATNSGTNIYIATATGLNGCTNSDTVEVTGLALPQVNAGQDVTICSGEWVTLNASGAVTYIWDNNIIDGVPFSPSATGTYTVTGTGINGCSNIDDVNVTVNALPVAGIVSVDPVTMAANPAGMNYQWFNCVTSQTIIGSTNDTLVATYNGSYAVIVTNGNGCTDTSDCVIVDQVGLFLPTSAVISLYPNPTLDFVTIELPLEEGANIFIYDAQGKLISKFDNAKNGQNVDLSKLSTGVYTFRITLNNLTHIEKVIKN